MMSAFTEGYITQQNYYLAYLFVNISNLKLKLCDSKHHFGFGYLQCTWSSGISLLILSSHNYGKILTKLGYNNSCCTCYAPVNVQPHPHPAGRPRGF